MSSYGVACGEREGGKGAQALLRGQVRICCELRRIAGYLADRSVEPLSADRNLAYRCVKFEQVEQGWCFRSAQGRD